MPLKIHQIQTGSLAAKNNISPNETILEINNNPIHDFLDLQYYSSDEKLKIELKTADGILHSVSIIQDWTTPLGIEPAPHACRNCANNCIFCFIDQMRPDIRKSLYVKDDDFRLSFVYGNFITLTNLTQRDFDRIIEQKLSPLYVSVHTTNLKLHKKMMQYKHDFNILKRLKLLAESGIELHTQIVLVPGWNDQLELQKTLQDLTQPPILSLSVGIVPVGLTKYRKSLTPISKMTSTQANETIRLAENFPNTYCSDEIFLLAKKPVPADEYYADYPQLENGIGMLRLLKNNWELNRDTFIKFLKKLNGKLVMITGVLASATISLIADEINNILPHRCRVVSIENHFLGKTVTVTGLLAAEDIFAQVNLRDQEIAVLPGNIFNHDLLTIDNISLQKVIDFLGGNLLLIDEEFENWELLN